MLINERHLHVEFFGPEDGHPVVLLHHGLGSVRAWRNQIPVLVSAGYRVVAYDRWGYGQSDPRPHLDAPDFKSDLSDLAVLLKTFEVKRPALIGHSDGGTIALYYAAQNAERVTALVTVAAHIYLEPKMEPGIRGIQHNFEHDARFRKGMQLVHGDKYEAVFWNWFNGWHKPAALGWDLRPQLGRISCPALIIQGENDEHATPQHARDIASAIPGAQLWLAPQANHMLPQEMAVSFNERLLEFLG
ncbi:MAG: alpha/beta fold hydrolase [Anaerolineae bacterium]|nr:alpha/beta fold hydrolase [Anaerolineae bacterium]